MKHNVIIGQKCTLKLIKNITTTCNFSKLSNISLVSTCAVELHDTSLQNKELMGVDTLRSRLQMLGMDTAGCTVHACTE